MGDYRKIEEYYEKLCKELDNQLGKELTGQQLDTMQKLTATIHYLDKMMEEEGEDEYSERSYRGGRSYRDGRRSYEGRSYEGGRSMRRGQRRDSMGRYSREYSRGGDFEEELRDLIDDAPDEQTKQAMRQMLQNMR